MERQDIQSTAQNYTYQFKFLGKGSEYFAIMIVNWLLTVVTFGFYYPWARAKRLRYIYGQTTLNNERFHFSGTGKEMFIGFIKIMLFYIAILVCYSLLFTILKSPALALLFLYLAILAIIPFAIHGSLRYRMSRTSYRGIRFGYRGNRSKLIGRFFKDLFFTIITLGFYSSWLLMNIRRYTHKHIRYGDMQFSNEAYGLDFFILNLKGWFLSLITLGIYIFWWERDLFNYYIDNMKMTKGDKVIECYSTASGGDFFELLVVNFFIVLFTLGFGKAWADMRTYRFIFNHIKMKGDINIEDIHQTEEEYTDAFGEDAMDFFDIDLA